MKKIVITIAIIFAVMFAGSFWSMAAANYTRADAQRIAVEHLGGGIAGTAEWDWELWRWVYYVEVLHQGSVIEFYINPVNGRIIEIGID